MVRRAVCWRVGTGVGCLALVGLLMVFGYLVGDWVIRFSENNRADFTALREQYMALRGSVAPWWWHMEYERRCYCAAIPEAAACVDGWWIQHVGVTACLNGLAACLIVAVFACVICSLVSAHPRWMAADRQYRWIDQTRAFEPHFRQALSRREHRERCLNSALQHLQRPLPPELRHIALDYL